MKVVVGCPGTWGGLLLRIGQCAFAAASIRLMVSSLGFSSYTAYCYLIASMGVQALWSLGLACLDIFALKFKGDLLNPLLVSLFMIGDWATAILSLAAVCSSAAVTVLFARDTNFCGTILRFSCSNFELSIMLAFISWLLISISSLVMFLLLASI